MFDICIHEWPRVRSQCQRQPQPHVEPQQKRLKQNGKQRRYMVSDDTASVTTSDDEDAADYAACYFIDIIKHLLIADVTQCRFCSAEVANAIWCRHCNAFLEQFGTGRTLEWDMKPLPDGQISYSHLKCKGCTISLSASLSKAELSKRLASHVRQWRKDDLAATTGKRKKPSGRPPNGMRWDDDLGKWTPSEEAAAQHAARDAESKAKREVEGRRGPGRPPLVPREPTTEANGNPSGVAVKVKQQAVLSSFMREYEALSTQIPEQMALGALQLEEPDDVSAQQVRTTCRHLPCALACVHACRYHVSYAHRLALRPCRQIKLHERFLDTAIAPLCKACKRRRPEIGFHLPSRTSTQYTARCTVCQQCEGAFTHANNNDPSPPPDSPSRPLYCGQSKCREWYDTLCRTASLTEELLVTKFRTFLIMRRMPHRHLRYRGHTIAFVQVSQHCCQTRFRNVARISRPSCSFNQAPLAAHI